VRRIFLDFIVAKTNGLGDAHSEPVDANTREGSDAGRTRQFGGGPPVAGLMKKSGAVGYSPSDAA